MTSLFYLVRKSIVARPLHLVVALVAIMFGTAIVAAAFTTNTSLTAALRAVGARIVGRADLVVEALDPAGFPISVVLAVEGLPGVQAVVPQVHKRVFYRTHVPTAAERPTALAPAAPGDQPFWDLRGRLTGRPVTAQNDRAFVELLGIDPTLDPVVHDYRIVEGRFLAREDAAEVLLARDWAEPRGLRVGTMLDLVTREGFRPFTVVGWLDEVDASQRTFGGLVRVPLRVAQADFGLDDRVHLLSLRLANPAAGREVLAALEGVIPQEFLVRETPRLLDELEASVQDLQNTLVLFAMLGLALGMLLVFNTLSLAFVAQRRELRLLQVAGATRRMLLGFGGLYGLILGASGGLAGAVLGQALALGLGGPLAAVQGVPFATLAISWPGAVLSLALGVSAAILVAVVPVLRSTGQYPLEPRARVAALRGGHWSSRVGVLLVVLIGSLAPLEGTAGRLVRVVLAILLFPAAWYACHPLLPYLSSLGGMPLRLVDRAAGVMAARNLNRAGLHSTLPLVSFAVSFSLLVALANSSASLATAGHAWVRSLFPGEVLIVSPVDQPLELQSEFVSLPGVEQVAAVSLHAVVWAGIRLSVVGVDPALYLAAFDLPGLERTAAFTQMRRGRAVLVPARLAADEGIRVGDTMPLRSGDREVVFTVAGVIPHSLPSPDNYGALVVAQRDLAQDFGVDSFRFLVVQPLPEADRPALERALAATAEVFGMESTPLGALQDSVGRSVGGLFGLLGALIALGVLVGGLNVALATTMNVIVRAFEIGVLRGMGLSRRQAQVLFVGEAGVLGFVGAVLGVALGAALTRIAVDLNRTAGFDPQFTFSFLLAAAVVVCGVTVAALAALPPIRAVLRRPIADLLP